MQNGENERNDLRDDLNADGPQVLNDIEQANDPDPPLMLFLEEENLQNAENLPNQHILLVPINDILIDGEIKEISKPLSFQIKEMKLHP